MFTSLKAGRVIEIASLMGGHSKPLLALLSIIVYVVCSCMDRQVKAFSIYLLARTLLHVINRNAVFPSSDTTSENRIIKALFQRLNLFLYFPC